MDDKRKILKATGRGASSNPGNRFETARYERFDDWPEEEDVLPRTTIIADITRSIISTNDSTDIGFRYGLNPYRGCEHGCIYCYARPYHEYLGYSSGIDFESKILVKYDAPILLRDALSSPKWEPAVIAMSGVTDCYQPLERKLCITRGCLEVLADFRNPVGIVTKNHLILRDIDVLSELAKYRCVGVMVSITSLDPDLIRIMEPRTAHPQRRLEVIRQLSERGIPVGVMTAPMIPGLNDHEMPAILEAAAKAGALSAGLVPVKLPYSVAPLFVEWLEKHFPERKEKILGRIRDMRNGKLYDSRFGHRMTGEGAYVDNLHMLFETVCNKLGLNKPRPGLSTEHFRRLKRDQFELFDGA